LARRRVKGFYTDERGRVRPIMGSGKGRRRQPRQIPPYNEPWVGDALGIIERHSGPTLGIARWWVSGKPLRITTVEIRTYPMYRDRAEEVREALERRGYKVDLIDDYFGEVVYGFEVSKLR